MDEEEMQRKVFNATLVLDRKAVITAVAINPEGNRLFLGMEDGILEEYTLVHSDVGPRASLTARKPIIARKPILAIFPAIDANCLAVLAADASLRFVHSDTFEGRIVHKGPIITAAITQHPAFRYPRIAITTKKTMGRALHISVHEIIPAGGQAPAWQPPMWEVDVPLSPFSSATGEKGGGASLAWCRESVILGMGSQYILTWPTSSLSPSKSPGKTQLLKGNWRELIALEEKQIENKVEGLPDQNCALLLADTLGLVVNSAGEPVGNPILLEQLPAIRALAAGKSMVAFISEDGIRIADPSTGQFLQGLGYGEGLRPSPGQPLRAVGGGTVGSSVIAVAGRHKAWVLTPVSPAEQTKDLLSRRDYDAALKLADEGLSRGEFWAEETYAQAGLLFLHECRISEAVAALENCSTAAFQPEELFALFPEHTEAWKPHSAPLHWNLNPPLEPLEELLKQRKGTSGEAEVHSAKQAIIQYLFRARSLPDVSTLDGVDTLLTLLLIDIKALEQTTAFAAVPNCVNPELVADKLLHVGWKHALATLWAASGHAEPALEIWKELAPEGQEDYSSRERQEAIAGAAALLKSKEACRPENRNLLSSYLPWLIQASPKDAGDVLACRDDLLPSKILPLLPIGNDTRWQYLDHLTKTQPSSSEINSSELHMELAVSLIQAIFKAEPGLEHLNGRREQLSRHNTAPLPMSTNQQQQRNISVAALVSGGLPPDLDRATDYVESLRFKLRLHLEASSLVDFKAVLEGRLKDSALLEESAIIYWKIGDHMAVLRLLALTLHDVGAAVTYASAFLPQSDHRLLLDLLLRPGNGQQPRWDDACRVVAVLGDSLDPLEMLQAAPEEMPMPAAVRLITPLIRERVHRRRQGQIGVALHRSQAAAGAVKQVNAEEQSVVIDEGRACPNCHLRLGGKVFVLVPENNNGEEEEQKDGFYAMHAAVSSSSNTNQNTPPKVLCLNCFNRLAKQE